MDKPAGAAPAATRAAAGEAEQHIAKALRVAHDDPATIDLTLAAQLDAQGYTLDSIAALARKAAAS